MGAPDIDELSVPGPVMVTPKWVDHLRRILSWLVIGRGSGYAIDQRGEQQVLNILHTDPPPRQFTPQIVVSADANTTYFQFQRNGGYVFLPYYKTPTSGDTEDQLPQFQHFPVVPTMDPSTPVSIIPDEGDPPPQLELTRGERSLICLVTNWNERTEPIGEYEETLSSGLYKLAADLISTDVSLPSSTDADGDPEHDHPITGTGSFNGPVVVGLQERNYGVNDTALVEVVALSEAEFLRDTVAANYLLMGWYDIDSDGEVSDSRWFVDGHLTVQRPPHVMSDSTDTSARNPTGPTALDSSYNYPVPGISGGV